MIITAPDVVLIVAGAVMALLLAPIVGAAARGLRTMIEMAEDRRAARRSTPSETGDGT
jgi:gas vesicle protein